MEIQALHHVQIAMPSGGETEAIEFYQGILGISQVAKPDHLARRGGCWFESGDVRIHLGVEDDFRPARKAHVALLVDDIDLARDLLGGSGIAVTMDQPLPGFDRFYVDDPFGNRIEVLSPTLTSTE